MSHSLDDPKLTAFALGELDEAQAKVVAAQVADSAEARAFIDEVRATAKLLTDEFASEPAPELTEMQRRRIDQKLTLPTRRFRPLHWAYAAVAASLVLAIAGFTAFRSIESSSPVTFSFVGDSLRDQSGAGAHTLAAATAAQAEHSAAAPLSVALVDANVVKESAPALPEQKSRETANRLWFAESLSESEKSVPQLASRFYAQRGAQPGSTPPAAAGAEVARLGAVRRQALGKNLYSDAFAVQSESRELADLDGRAVDESLRRKLARDSLLRREELELTPHLEAKHNTETYDHIADNPFLAVKQNPLSTFSIDVDTAAYSIMRRFLAQNNQLPPKGSVRIEEMVNYFSYDYQQPTGEDPFSVNLEVAGCPWKPEHRLLRVGLKGKEIAKDKRPASNLVFLIDVSGSMQPANRLPLVKRGLKMLIENLGENDRVAMTVYAGAAGLVLPSTIGDAKETILDALDRLQAGGSTAGGAGIQLAYDVAVSNIIKGGVNRVILCTDGDFNVGVTDRGSLVQLIEQKAKTGVFLSVLGFGMGNLKDATLEQLSDKGNGNYAYIDSDAEARKVLVEQMGGTLVTIAKDVKIQIEFNPAKVGAYRLIGYENRMLRAEDFKDDTKDAGEIGAGHTVTAIYELAPPGSALKLPDVDPLKFQKPATPEPNVSDDLLLFKLRYKQPDGNVSKELQQPLKDAGKRYAEASGDFKFAAAVASFGMLLRDSPHKGNATFGSVVELAQEGLGPDPSGRRKEFLDLVRKAQSLKR